MGAGLYRLVVTGDVITDVLRLRYDELVETSSNMALECETISALFGSIRHRERGAVGMAEQAGVPLAEVLEHADVTDDTLLAWIAVHQRGRQPLRIAKAMGLLAYRMDGALLPKDHGLPVPGWVGSSKGLSTTSKPIWSRNNTISYALIGNDMFTGKQDSRTGSDHTIHQEGTAMASSGQTPHLRLRTRCTHR